MRKADPESFGIRVKKRREELGMSQELLGEESGYSQQRIGSIEKGEIKRPERCASALADALSTTREWLLWAEGVRSRGPRFMRHKELVEKYDVLPVEDRAAVSEFIEKRLAEAKNADN